MISSIAAILVVAAMLIAAFGAGRAILPFIAPREEDRLSASTWSICLGLVAYGVLFMLLGVCGVLFEPLIVVATLAGGCWGVREIFNLVGEQREIKAPSPVLGPPPATAWFLRCACWLAALCAAASLVSALAPPTAGDAMCYHLQLPKEFLQAREIAFAPDSENNTFPLFAEMWFLWAIALDGGVAAQVFAWSLGVLFAIAATLLARPFLGERNAWGAGAIVLIAPGVTNQMTAALNDVALALFTTMAIVAWREAVFGEGEWRCNVLSGAMWGCALGIKYVAFVPLAPVGIVTAWKLVQEKERRRVLFAGLLASGAIALPIAGTWYARAAVHRGNPVYPFFEELAGRGERSSMPASKAKLGRSPLSLVIAPWELTMRPEKFGGRGAQLGVIFLLAAPGLLTARRLHGMKLIGGLILGYGIVWIALRQNLRFALPVLPLLGIAAAWSLMELCRFPRAPRLAAQGIAVAALLFSALFPCARGSRALAVATGFESHAAFLDREEPTWRAVTALREDSLRSTRILSQDYRGFYFPCAFTREAPYRKRTQYDHRVQHPGDLRRLLWGEGFTHVLLAETVTEGATPNDTTLSQLVDRELKSADAGHWTTNADYTFTDREGVARRYRLLEIK